MPDTGDLWVPEDYAQAAQRATFKHLSPVVRDLFSRHLGRDWARAVLDQLIAKNKEIRDRPSKHPGGNTPPKLPQLVDGRLDWDFPQMVRAIREMVDKLPELKEEKNQVITLCRALGDVRNKLGHENAIVSPDESKKHVERLVSLGKLILGEDANIPRVAALLGDLIRLSSPGGERLAMSPLPRGSSLPVPAATNANEMREIREMLSTLLRRTEQAGARQVGNAGSRTSGAGATTSHSFDAEGGRHEAQRRRTQLPAPRPGLCLFPIVAEGDGATDVGELGYVNTNTYQPEGRQPDLSRVTGFSGAGRSDVYYQVIQDARFGEDDPAKANLHTHARVDPGDFIGSSFGLAAALADRSARYGWAPELRDRVIIATGIIGKGGRGQVEPIGSFAEKLAFLDRQAPAGALFLYPAGNAEGASLEVRALLARLKANGRITLWPVRHLSELGDLFGAPEKAPRQVETGGIPPADKTVAGRPEAASREAKRAPSGTGPLAQKARRPEGESPEPRQPARRLTRHLWSTGLAGAALLAGIYFIAERSESGRASPEQLQRISDLLGAHDGKNALTLSAAQCRTLAAAGQALTDEDKARLDAQGARALAAAKDCAQRLVESRQRIVRFENAKKVLASSGPTPASCTALDIADAGLQPFDREELDTAKAAVPSYTEPCKTVLAESDRKIRTTERLVEIVARNPADLVGCRELVSAFEQLSNDDMERLAARGGAVRERAYECSARIADSEARLRTVRNAQDAFDSSDLNSARALLSARSRLTPADLGQLSPQQSAALQSATQRAGALIGASDARIRNFLASYAAWQANPTTLNATRFAQAGDQLTTFDRTQQVGDIQGALTALQRVKEGLAARAQRWSLVERLTNAAEGLTPADYWEKLKDAVERLTVSDREAMTPEQTQLLQRAQMHLGRGERKASEFGTTTGR